MPEMQNKTNWGSPRSFRISCVVDRAKLPNLVNVAIVVFIYFWRKIKAFQPLELDAVMKFNLYASI